MNRQRSPLMIRSAARAALLAALWLPLAAGGASEADPAAGKPDPKVRLEELNKRTEGLAQRMDGLSAEAQDLIWNNTNEKLTTFLKDIDTAMLDARDLLEQYKTSGDTVAAQQDVLEKIYEAAKKAAQKSQQQQQQQKKEGQEGKEGQPGEGQGEGKPGQDGQPGQGKPGEAKPGEGKPGEGQGQQENQDDGGMSSMLKMMEQMLGITPAEQPGGKPGGDKPGDGQKEGPGKGDDSAVKGPANKQMTEERSVPRASGNTSGLLPPEYRDRMESFRKGLDQLELEDARAPRQP